MRECGAYSVKKFTMGICVRKLPYICQKDFAEDNVSAIYDDNLDFNGRPREKMAARKEVPRTNNQQTSSSYDQKEVLTVVWITMGIMILTALIACICCSVYR